MLTQQLCRPAGLSAGTTPVTSPRITPNRSVSPRVRPLEVTERLRRIRASAPKFYAVPRNRVAHEGETVRFQCSIAGHPEPWATWHKDGKPVVPSGRVRMTELEDLRILEIREVTNGDSGLYKVALENDVGRIEASARLDVVAHRVASSDGLRARSLSPRTSPTYTKSILGASSKLGTRTRLYCDIKATPAPFLRWYKDGVPLEDSLKYSTEYDGEIASIEIDDVQREDEGLYTCVATNVNGTAETSVYLEVISDEKQAPEIIEPLSKDVQSVEGSAVKLELKVRGSQPLDVIWFKDGCVLPDCKDFVQSYCDGLITLWLPEVYGRDSGNYRCEVYNLYGEAYSKTTLEVLGEFYFKNLKSN